MRKSFRVLTLAVLFLSLALTACGGGGGGGGTPADGAKGFFEAVFKNDSAAAKGYICKALEAQADQMVSSFAAIAGGGASGVTVDSSGLSFTVENESGDKATVKFSGKLKVTVGGVSQDVDMGAAGAAPIPMLKEDGKWKVCS